MGFVSDYTIEVGEYNGLQSFFQHLSPANALQWAQYESFVDYIGNQGYFDATKFVQYANSNNFPLTTGYAGGIPSILRIPNEDRSLYFCISYARTTWNSLNVCYYLSTDGTAAHMTRKLYERNSNIVNNFIIARIGNRIGIVYPDNMSSSYAALNYSSTACFVNLDRLQGMYTDYGNSETTSSSPEFGEASQEGGYTGGTFDDSSDVIAMPTTPTMGVTSAGFVNVYSPTQGELQNFGAELFPDLSFVPDTPITPTSGIQEAIEAMANVFVTFGNQIPNIVEMFINSNLIQYVIDCHILPVAPTTGGTANIKVGFKQFTPTPAVVTSDYVDFDCGSLNIGEYYANFIDYAPYTKSKLFLPFVGFVDLAPEFWQAGTLSVKYRFNIIDGSFMAFVIATSSKSKLSNTVVAQFGGNACVHIPITGLNYSSMVSGVVGAAAGIATAQSGVQAASKAIGGAVDVANSKPPMQQSNGYNATTSFLGVRTPYLMIERSVSNFSMNYPDEMGIPSNITSDFSKLHGYTKATNIHLDGIAGATQTELDEIAALLAEGVIL